MLYFYKKDKRMHAEKAQSTVEYLLLVSAVIGVVVVFTTLQGPNSFRGGLNSVFNQTTQDMINVTSRLSQ